MTEKMKGVVGPITEYDEEFKIKEETILAEELEYEVGKKLRRCILYYSEQKAERDLKARMKNIRLVEKELSKAVEKYQKQGGRGRKPKPKKTIKDLDELVSRKNVTEFFNYRFVGGRGGRRFKWSRDDDALENAKDLDGKYVLITTLSNSPKDILTIYRSRVVVERAFRTTKEKIKIRPIWSTKEEHIRAHLFICFLAYLLMSLIELKLRRAGDNVSGPKAIKRMSNLMREVDREIKIDNGSNHYRAFKNETKD